MSHVMTTEPSPVGLKVEQLGKREQPTGGALFDWIVVILSSWLLGGAQLDGWAHAHVIRLESFFTPWHAVLYSGFLSVAVFLAAALIVNHRKGYSWQRSLPAGYELSLIGAVVFGAGGVGDMIWHEIFGIETDFDALVSPTHLVLVLGIALIVSGPLRAAWRRLDPPSSGGWVRKLPSILSITLTLSALTFITEYSHPFVNAWGGMGYRMGRGFFSQSLGATGIMFQTGLLMGMVLLAVRRWGWSLPVGSFTLIFTINVGLISFFHDTYLLIPAAAAGGVVSDVLLKLIKPSAARRGAFRLFAFVVPVVLYISYFLDLMITGGIWWSIHLWVGSIAMAGIVGWLMSYAFLPPLVPAEQPG